MRPLALGLRAPYRLKRTIALLAQATLNLDFTKGGPLDSRVTFSRASGGTSFRPVGRGANLIALDFANWGSGGNISSFSALSFTTSAAGGMFKAVPGWSASKLYVLTVTGTATSNWNVRNTENGTGMTAVTAGAFSLSLDVTQALSASTLGQLYLQPIGACTISFTSFAFQEITLDRPGDPIQLFTAPANVPRFDWDQVSGRCKGLLIEEQRTNLLTFSNDFANAAWVKSPSGVGAAPQISGTLVDAPDGTLTATRVTLNNTGTTSSDWSWLLSNVSCATGLTYCASAWVRASTPGDVGKQVLWPGVGGLALKTLTAEWKLVENIATAVANGTYSFGPRLRGTETTATSVTLDIWQAQVEVGAFTTSRIPTTGAAATRAQDIAYIATAGWLNTSVGTMLLDFNQLVPPSQQDANAIYFGAYLSTALTNGEDMGYTLYAANNFLTRNPAMPVPSLGGAAGQQRIALAVDGTGKYSVRNGGAVLSQLGAGYNNSGAPTVYSLSGTKTGTKCAQHVRRLGFWPRRMSNLDLIGLTR